MSLVSSFFITCLSPNKTCLWFCYLLLFSLGLQAQYASLVNEWDQDYGGSGWEDLHDMQETPDGGYILAGITTSQMSGDVSEASYGQGDFWVVKTNETGDILWNKRYGGSGMERPWSVRPTPDGGYIIGGWSDSDIGGLKSENSRGFNDYWVIKTDANGELLWDRTYGGDTTDLMYALIPTRDGGYLMGGLSASNAGFEKSEARKGDFDIWIVKIDEDGDYEWDRSYGGSEEDRLNWIEESPDGHFLLGGGTRSGISGDVTTPLLGVKDAWLLKVNSNGGDILWQQRYGGTDEDEINTFALTNDGGMILGCGSRSDAFAPYKTQNNRGIVDMWVLKTDADGNREWDITLGGADLENCYSVKQNSIGHYLIGGFSGSDIGIDKDDPLKGALDYWLIYLDPDGQKLWDKSLGGDDRDVLENLFQTSDGGYLLGGHSITDISGDKTQPNKGLNDFWLIKTACNLSLNIPDVRVCANEPFELDAYDPNCIACEWEWSDNNTDSIRMASANMNTVFSVTLTDGVGCARFADVNVEIIPALPVDLGGDQQICEGEQRTLDAGNAAMSYEWSGGQTTASIEIDTANTYSVTLTNTDGCTSEDQMTLFVNPAPIVDLGTDTSFCTGSSVDLDAGNPGASYQWSVLGNNQLLSVSNIGAYSVTVTDANNCSAADTIEVRIYLPPQALNILEECNDDNTSYTVSFEISGGDFSTYAVSPMTGTLINGVFTSDPIPKDQAYNFMIDDGRSCGPTAVGGSYDCECTTIAAILDTDPQIICGNEQVTIGVISNSVLDANDVEQYLLHDGDVNTIGTILAVSTSPVFSFSQSMTYGTTYYITAIAANGDLGGNADLNDGCFAQSAGVAVVFQELPEAIIEAQTDLMLSCSDGSLILDGTRSTPIGQVDFEWFTNNGSIVGSNTLPQLEVDEVGEYFLIVIDPNSNCRDTSAIEVLPDDDLPVAFIQQVDKITCDRDSVLLDATGSSEGMDFSYEWTGGSLVDANDMQVFVDQPLLYTLVVTNDSNGCTATATITVEEDRIAPMVNAGDTDFLNCLDQSLSLSGSFSSNGDAQFNWSTTNGHFVSGQQTLQPIVDEAGLYILEVTNLDNGCTASDEVIIDIDPDVPHGVALDIREPSCYGEEDGQISIQNVLGGTPPLLYSLDGENFFDNKDYIRLGAGSYQLWVQDANGCQWVTTLVLNQPAPFVISLGGPLEIQLGDSIRLAPQVNLAIDNFYWDEDPTLSCTDCWNPIASPVATTNYQLFLQSDQCMQMAEVRVIVVQNRLVYIPTAFSPNGDGFNDYLAIYAGTGVTNVKTFRIYSRWGALVHEQTDVLPNLEPEGWDGRFKGKILDPGVYVYYAEIEFADGLIEIYQGDITLMR